MESNFSSERVKPFILEYREAREEVFEAINNIASKHGMPMCLVESILSEALSQAKEVSRKEIADAEKAYENYITEEHPRKSKGE